MRITRQFLGQILIAATAVTSFSALVRTQRLRTSYVRATRRSVDSIALIAPKNLIL